MSTTTGDRGPREGWRPPAIQRSFAHPQPCRGFGGVPSLWKTLRSLAMHSRAVKEANTGVSAKTGSGARNPKRPGSQGQRGSRPRGETAHPSGGMGWWSRSSQCGGVRLGCQVSGGDGSVGWNRVSGLTGAHMIPSRENHADCQGKPLPFLNAVQCRQWRTLSWHDHTFRHQGL